MQETDDSKRYPAQEVSEYDGTDLSLKTGISSARIVGSSYGLRGPSCSNTNEQVTPGYNHEADKVNC